MATVSESDGDGDDECRLAAVGGENRPVQYQCSGWWQLQTKCISADRLNLDLRIH